MLHAAPISLPFSARCAYFPSPQGCTVIPSPLPRCLCVSTANRVFSAVCSLLSSLCALFCTRFLCFQQLAASFCKTPGVGYPGPLSTFRCAFCIPNVFTGPSDVQTFRRGCASAAARSRHRSHGGVARRQSRGWRKMRNGPKLLKTFTFRAVVLEAVWPRECL